MVYKLFKLAKEASVSHFCPGLICGFADCPEE